MTQQESAYRMGRAGAPGPVVRGSLVTWDGLFTPAELDAITAYGDALTHEKAEVADTTRTHPNLRVTQVAWFERNAATEVFYRRMEDAVLALNAKVFRFDLVALAPFQYALYRGAEKGHFDWHKDYGRDPTHPAQEPRKLTLSLQLSDGADYEGCDLEVRGGNEVEAAPRTRGTLLAFPANVLHRVTPITAGTRRSLVLWATGPDFR